MRMRKLFGNKQMLLSLLALALLLGLTVKSSLAYFTTYAEAKGTRELILGWETELTEEFKDGAKHIQVDNVGELECYVRVRVIAGALVNLEYSGSEKWTLGEDGYLYYSDIVPAGGHTEELIASITHEKIEADYDVVVIQECAPVRYTSEGEPLPCTDGTVWSQSFEEKEGA